MIHADSRLPRFLAAAACLFASAAAVAPADPVGPRPLVSDAKSGQKTWRYQPSQINHPIPKFEYTDAGQAILLRRYPFFPTTSWTHLQKYRYLENKQGVEHFEACQKIKREADDILSEEQKAILAEWGQPDYLRGPYKSTRGDSVVEWCYHPLNRIFQFVDRRMVYEGPLTDQDRTAITYGAPSETVISQLEPNIRRETWIYRPQFLSGRERVFSFSNGKQVYAQETP